MSETRPQGTGAARGQGGIAAQTFWETHLFLADWPEYGTRGARVAQVIRAFAEDFETDVASNVGISMKPAKGLVESPLNFFECVDDPDMAALVRWFDVCVRSVVSAVNGGAVPPDRLRTEFADSWFHITNGGGFHDAHTHGHCSWCGIFYVSAGESGPGRNGAAGNGINRFYGPHSTGGLFSDFGNAYLRRMSVDVEPADGRLVLFPANLLHSALPYSGTTDRIILSFNSRTWKR